MIKRPVKTISFKFLGVEKAVIVTDASYNINGLITLGNKNVDFLRDPEFIKGYDAAMR